MKEQTAIKEKIDKIIATSSTEAAILRLNGYLKQYHWDQYLRTQLAQLHLEQGSHILAGKLFYFKSNKTTEEEQCVKVFKESCGNKGLVEFYKLKGTNNSKLPRGISINMNEQLFQLFLRIADQEGSLPIDIVRWICNYERIRNIELKKGWLKESNQ